MSSLETRKIEPQSGTTVTLGEAGDTVTAPTGAIVKTNTVKDSGGNTLFTSDGAGTLSSVNSAFVGSMDFISSITASSSASIEFTTGIDDTYDEYIFYFVGIHPATNSGTWQFQMDAAGTSYNTTMTTTYFRALHTEDNTTTRQLAYDSGNDQNQGTGFQYLAQNIMNDNDADMCGELHLFAPWSTTYVKQFYSRCGAMRTGPLTSDVFVAGYFNSTAALTKVKFKMDNGNTDAGTVYLYGVN